MADANGTTDVVQEVKDVAGTASPEAPIVMPKPEPPRILQAPRGNMGPPSPFAPPPEPVQPPSALRVPEAPAPVAAVAAPFVPNAAKVRQLVYGPDGEAALRGLHVKMRAIGDFLATFHMQNSMVSDVRQAEQLISLLVDSGETIQFDGVPR